MREGVSRDEGGQNPYRRINFDTVVKLFNDGGIKPDIREGVLGVDDDDDRTLKIHYVAVDDGPAIPKLDQLMQTLAHAISAERWHYPDCRTVAFTFRAPGYEVY